MERMNALVFEVVQEADGGLLRRLPHGKHVRASWLVGRTPTEVIEAVNAFYFDKSALASVRRKV